MTAAIPNLTSVACLVGTKKNSNRQRHHVTPATTQRKYSHPSLQMLSFPIRPAMSPTSTFYVSKPGQLRPAQQPARANFGLYQTTTVPSTDQDLTAATTFVLERYSRLYTVASVAANTSPNDPTSNALVDVTSGHNNNSNNNDNNNHNQNQANVAQTKMSSFGGVSILSNRASASNFPNNNKNNDSSSSSSRNATKDTTDNAHHARPWSVSTTTAVVASTGSVVPAGRTLPETRGEWTHLSTPNHHIVLTLRAPHRLQNEG